MTKPIVLYNGKYNGLRHLNGVTGATGYLGSHVAAQLLEKGYIVRAAVRLGKSGSMRDLFPDAGDNLETTEIETLNSDFTVALQGVGAVIHCASPITYDGKALVDAIKSGIKKIVITGTALTQYDIEFKGAFGTELLGDKSYGATTLESIDLETAKIININQVAKTDTDKKVWKIAHENPDVDFTIILPPGIFGAHLPTHPFPADVSGLSAQAYVYDLVSSSRTGGYPTLPVGHMVDVRDAAKAHVLALTTAPLNDGRDKRFGVCSKIFTWSGFAQVIRERRPELADRLPGPNEVARPQMSVPMDTQFAADVLGLTEYIPWEETLLSSVDYVLKWEKATSVLKT